MKQTPSYSVKLITTGKKFKSALKAAYVKLIPLYLKRILNYLNNLVRFTLYDCRYWRPKYLKKDLAKFLNEFENFASLKITRSYWKRFNQIYHITNGRAHEFIYGRQKEYYSISERSSEISDKIISLIKLAYKAGSITSEISKKDLIKLKQEYHSNGYIVLPFRLSSLEISQFKSKTKPLSYTLFSRQDGGPTQDHLPDDLNCAKAKMYSVLETSESESFYPKDVESIIFLLCHYLLEISKLEVVSSGFSYSFYQKSEWELGYDSAQNWHWDLDAIEFIKSFTYFTDVSESDGPHQACLGSQKQKPLLLRSFWPYRVPNYIIRSLYKITSFELMAGSIILGNTKCLHRGLPLTTTNSYRLMHQFYLTNSPGSFYYALDKNYKTSEIYAT